MATSSLNIVMTKLSVWPVLSAVMVIALSSASADPAIEAAIPVEALVWSWETKFQSYPDAGMALIEYGFTLLRDGSCVRTILEPLDDATLASYRAKHAREVCRWKKAADTYRIADASGAFTAPPHAVAMRAATKRDHLAGTYTRSKTGHLATMATWRGTRITFDPSGHFESAVNTAMQTTDRSTSRQPTVVGTSSTGVERGTYVLDGFAIELHFESGRLERHVFATSGDRAHGWIRLGGLTLPRSTR